MEVKTYRAKTIQEAMQLVRDELGPKAAVLHTRKVSGGMLRWLTGGKRVEVTASKQANIRSRFEMIAEREHEGRNHFDFDEDSPISPPFEQDFRARFRSGLREMIGNSQATDLQSIVEQLSRPAKETAGDMPHTLFRLFAELIDAEVGEDLARELVQRLRESGDMADFAQLKERSAELIEREIKVCGPITVECGYRKLVALVGPTGVGKTTTIAKLAANFRLREKRRVGLITVDTYRIAAVDQLRTYAEIIDLPMEVVSTPREMREAVARMADLDLILMDTAGRSPRDEVKIQELRSMIGEAGADEVLLVLSGNSSAATLSTTAAKFADVGVTSLVLTKLDEATGLGNLIPLLRSSKLPLSYLTNGQNVPDDIESGDCRRLSRMILGM